MHRDEILKRRTFSRRTFIIGLAKIGIFGAIGLRLYNLQIKNWHKYHTLSDKNRIRLLLVTPKRGLIFDRNNIVLARNLRSYRLLINKAEKPNLEKIKEILETILPLSDEEKAHINKKLSNYKSSSDLLLLDQLTWDEVCKIEVNSANLHGIMLDLNQTRSYPYGPATAHLLGFVGMPDTKDSNGPIFLNKPDIKIGKSGIEKTYEDVMQGQIGIKKVEVNASGSIVRELDYRQPAPGYDLILTIDSKLQRFCFNQLDPKGAACVVMNVKNGQILALCSTPSFDPNLLLSSSKNSYWQEILKLSGTPLLNKATNSLYPPGSIFKLVVALAALESSVPPNTTFECTGQYNVGNINFHCWKDDGHGVLNLVDAISQSCNCYFFNLARRIGIDRINYFAEELGLGEANYEGINCLNSVIPGKRWKMNKTRLADW